MSFRCRQIFRPSGFQVVMVPEQVTLESGVIVDRVADLTKEKLPEPELFDLKNQLKAGIDLEEVNSKVLGSKYIDADKVISKVIRGRGRPSKTESSKEIE